MSRHVYASTFDPGQATSWSGAARRMMLGYREARPGAEVCFAGEKRRPLDYLLSALALLQGKRHLADREFRNFRKTARLAHETAGPTGEILSCQSTLIGYLDPGPAAYFWTDATFAGLVGYYSDFAHLTAHSLRKGHEAEQRALDRCTKAFYCSEWARQTALDHYKVDPEKLKVLPFGAIIPDSTPLTDAVELARQTELKMRSWEADQKLSLLLVGVDWVRKGGPLVLEVMRHLRRMGAKPELHVAGCEPQDQGDLPVKRHGFLNKANAADAAKLADLFQEAHFLMVPSVAECFGLVYAEAMAWGAPPIGRDTGGVSTIIHHGENGGLFSDGASAAEEIAQWIKATLDGPGRYESLVKAGRAAYETRFNWTSAIKELLSHLPPS